VTVVNTLLRQRAQSDRHCRRWYNELSWLSGQISSTTLGMTSVLIAQMAKFFYRPDAATNSINKPEKS